MSQTYTINNTDTNLVTEECYRCGVLFAMPESLRNSALKHSQKSPGETISFYCPNGHSQSYVGENTEQKLRRQLNEERERRARVAAQRDQAEASARAYKGAATKARKRAGAGVCPCCNRTFKQLARHMESKHPDFEPEAVEA